MPTKTTKPRGCPMPGACSAVAVIERMHAEELRLSQGLCALAEAGEDVPASVLRSVAYDIALNCITPDVARFQIERRSMKVIR